MAKYGYKPQLHDKKVLSPWRKLSFVGEVGEMSNLYYTDDDQGKGGNPGPPFGRDHPDLEKFPTNVKLAMVGDSGLKIYDKSKPSGKQSRDIFWQSGFADTMAACRDKKALLSYNGIGACRSHGGGTLRDIVELVREIEDDSLDVLVVVCFLNQCFTGKQSCWEFWWGE
jgi:hypothetical protein